jgi:hypothetical protein
VSKVSEARERQGYVSKATPQTCATCAHFSSRKEKHSTWMGRDYFKEHDLRCGIGSFAVKKQGTCHEWGLAPASSASSAQSDG